ncbi:MAG: N-acetylmuramoyl-L-alanine amidase [Paracoccaceae bacterium]|nr:N-acetylmuramoyl-L-alanine amidase [Paracoccaceae bacterium]
MIHYTAMPSAQAACARLCDPQAEVSAHYLIDVDGTVLALVAEEQRAWHAGAGEWGGRADINSRSVGVELANTGAEPFAARQMDALEHLLAGIMGRWSIPAQGVIGHSDMAPGRKADPGPKFDWRRLARCGLSVWPGQGGDGARPLGPSLDRIGYPDVAPDLRLAAFRLRFRPWAQGPQEAQDRALASDLAGFHR